MFERLWKMVTGKSAADKRVRESQEESSKALEEFQRRTGINIRGLFDPMAHVDMDSWSEEKKAVTFYSVRKELERRRQQQQGAK